MGGDLPTIIAAMPMPKTDPHRDDDLPADDGDALDRRPSKTRRKKDMHALQNLGERLVDIAETKLAALELPERLADAIRAAREIRSHEGRRRQLQFIGKLMRDVDPTAIEAALEVDVAHHRASVRVMHEAEHWRDALLNGERTLTDFIDRHPLAAGAGLPQLLSQARREREQDRPPRSQRQLYRELHRLIGDTDAS